MDDGRCQRLLVQAGVLRAGVICFDLKAAFELAKEDIIIRFGEREKSSLFPYSLHRAWAVCPARDLAGGVAVRQKSAIVL